jgi:hypothetical protein
MATRKIFGYGHTGRVAIVRGTAGKNKRAASGGFHGEHQRHHAFQILLKVFEWLHHSRAHGFESGKVNDGGNLVAMN